MQRPRIVVNALVFLCFFFCILRTFLSGKESPPAPQNGFLSLSLSLLFFLSFLSFVVFVFCSYEMLRQGTLRGLDALKTIILDGRVEACVRGAMELLNSVYMGAHFEQVSRTANIRNGYADWIMSTINQCTATLQKERTGHYHRREAESGGMVDDKGECFERRLKRCLHLLVLFIESGRLEGEDTTAENAINVINGVEGGGGCDKGNGGGLAEEQRRSNEVRAGES